MDIRHCLSPYCFNDQVVTSCLGLLINWPWYTFAHRQIGSGASFDLLSKGIKNWCASPSSTGTRLFERCCHFIEGFIELMQRGPREREACYLRFTIHAVLTVDAGSLTFLSGWDAATTSNQQVVFQTLDEYIFGVRRGKWREAFFKKRFISITRVGVFSFNRHPGK